jgi:uncharacterized protein
MKMMAEPLQFWKLMQGNRAGRWTTVGGGILIFVIWQAAIMLVALKVPLVTAIVTNQAGKLSASDEAMGMFVLLVGGFGPGFLALLAWRKLMERRGIQSVFTGVRRIRWSIVLTSALCVGGIGLGLTLGLDPAGSAYISARAASFSSRDWLILCCAYGIGISIQATFEEVYVRGWLLQHVARFVPNAIGVVVVTALVFMAIHVGHPGWATYVATLLFGLAFGWSAIRLNGLEAAIGAHVANNLTGALLGGAMISGNAPTMSASDFALYAAYVLGFLVFVEVWARFLAKPSRA